MAAKFKNPRVWLYSLASAFIGGGASAFCAAFVAPETFNFTHDGLIKMAQLFVAAGIVTAMGYLKQSPLPQLEDEPEAPAEKKPNIGEKIGMLIAIGSIAVALSACPSIPTKPTANVIVPPATAPQAQELNGSDIIDGLKKAQSYAVSAYKTETGQRLVHGVLIFSGKLAIANCVPESDQASIKSDMLNSAEAAKSLKGKGAITDKDAEFIFTKFYPTTGGARAQQYNQVIGIITGFIADVAPSINIEALGSLEWYDAFLDMVIDAAYVIGGGTSNWTPYKEGT